MQNRPRYSFIRRLLFPYSGEEPLSRSQGLRIILSWALFFSSLMILCTSPIALVIGAHMIGKTILFLLISFLAGLVVFGILAWFVVYMSNRAARLFQARKTRTTGRASGGRYGS
jgi:ABC-type bacteriocin/lantibiotic exporter with double-glycine peptidase domain